MEILTKSFLLFFFFTLILLGCEKEKKVPVITTTPVSNINGTTAICGGIIIDEGSSSIFTRGVCWSISNSPTITENKTSDGAGTGSFSSNITGLDGATTYFLRAFATNSYGTGYGEVVSFTTLGQAPFATTLEAIYIVSKSALLNGTVNAKELNTVVTFEYGLSSEYGNSILASQSPVSGNANINVSAYITSLSPGMNYHFRVKTENDLGTSYGDDLTFTTLGQSPSAITQSATDITITSAKLNGIVNANEVNTVVTFEYGLSTDYGTSVTADQSPVIGNSMVTVSTNITGLSLGTTYHFRVKAENSLGETYSDDLTFRTNYTGLTGTVSDIEGNTYKTVGIGRQLWMAENLKYLPSVVGPATGSETDPYYYVYGFNGTIVSDAKATANYSTYGVLYNWPAAMNGAISSTSNPSGVQGVCPTGWHIPSDAEWTELTDYLGGERAATNKLKEVGSTHWSFPNIGATNESGFTALPSGSYYSNEYNSIGIEATWLSSTVDSTTYSTTYVWARNIINTPYSDVSRGLIKKQTGSSVRCLKD